MLTRRPTKLTEAHLNLRIAEKRAKPLGALLLSSGALEGPYRAPGSRLRRFIRALLASVPALRT